MKKTGILFILILILFSFKKEEKTWVAIGDSITYLNEHKDQAGNRISKGYMTMVTEKLKNIKYVNQGHNGWTAKKIADDIEKLNIEKADIYSIFLGTNDWWRGLPLGSYEDYSKGSISYYGSIGLIIEKLRSLNPKAKVLLITPMQRGDFVYYNGFGNNAYGSYKPKNDQNLSQFADSIVEIGKKQNIKVVDLYNQSGITLENMVNFKRLKVPNTDTYKNFKYPEYLDIPFDPKKDEYPYPIEAINMTYDGLHPSDKGYEVISNMLIKVMKKWD